MLRPSMRGSGVSSAATSSIFSYTRTSISLPISGCVISRPRKKTDTLTRCFFSQKPADVVDLEVHVVLAGARAEFDFLHHDLGLVLPRLLILLFLQVPELAVVHDPADGRRRVGRDLDEVEFLAQGVAECLAQRPNTDLFAVGVNHAHLAGADLLVDTDTRFSGYDAPPGRRSCWTRARNASTDSGSIFSRWRPRGATVPNRTSLSPMTSV